MFDLKTFKVLGRIPAAEDADAIVFDGVSNRVFTLNGDAHSSTVIDASTGKLVTNIPLAASGRSMGFRRETARYMQTSRTLVRWLRIDTKTATVGRRWSTAPCKQPVSMAIDPAHHRLFSGCRSGVLAVSDYQAGKAITTVPIGTGVDGAGYDAASSGNVFASNADGTLTVIHPDSPDQYHVVENVPTPVGSRNMGLDPTNHRLYIVSAKFGPAPAGGRSRGPVLPGSFTLMTIEKDSSCALSGDDVLLRLEFGDGFSGWNRIMVEYSLDFALRALYDLRSSVVTKSPSPEKDTTYGHAQVSSTCQEARPQSKPAPCEPRLQLLIRSLPLLP